MITEFIIQAFVGFVVTNLSFLDNFTISFNTSIMDPFLNVVGAALYFFPWQYVLPILGVILALWSLRFAISLLKLIVSFIPFF